MLKLRKIYKGYNNPKDLPVQPGDMVTIPKGTVVRMTAPHKRKRVAKKTYQIKVDHILPGSNTCLVGGKFSKSSNPTVRWLGIGGYWQEVDINDIPETP